MNTHRCAECARLQAEVGEVFESLVKLTQAQLNAFRANDQATMMRMDKELENTVGEKERRIGAMRQYAREHKCTNASRLSSRRLIRMDRAIKICSSGALVESVAAPADHIQYCL
jgi:hypothetical protein